MVLHLQSEAELVYSHHVKKVNCDIYLLITPDCDSDVYVLIHAPEV